MTRRIGDKIDKIIGEIAEANWLEKVIDLADFNDEEKLGKGKETQIVSRSGASPRSRASRRGNSALGRGIACLAKVVGIGPGTRQDHTVYDHTCGLGSLLLKVADEAPRGITIYGQEKGNVTWALAKMILHGNEDGDIRKGRHDHQPGGQLRTFDFALANPLFSINS